MAYYLYTSHYERIVLCCNKRALSPELKCCFYNSERETKQSKLEKLLDVMWAVHIVFLFLLYCVTTGNQCGAFTYENIAVGVLGSISFSSCHKWSHGKIIHDQNFFFFFSHFVLLFSLRQLVGEKIEIYDILQFLENTQYILRNSIHTVKR